jgi:hypothetical protein
MTDARELVQKLYQMYDNVPHTSYRFKSCPDYFRGMGDSLTRSTSDVSYDLMVNSL